MKQEEEENLKFPTSYQREDIGNPDVIYQPHFRFDTRGRQVFPLAPFNRLMLDTAPGSKEIKVKTENSKGDDEFSGEFITDIEGNSTKIAQNATDILVNATDIAGNTTNISINASGIAVNVTDISGNSASIIVNADNINLRVEKAHVVTEINLRTEGIYIHGEMIELDGDVHVLDDFSVGGDMIVGGTITGVKIRTADETLGDAVVLSATGEYADYILFYESTVLTAKINLVLGDLQIDCDNSIQMSITNPGDMFSIWVGGATQLQVWEDFIYSKNLYPLPGDMRFLGIPAIRWTAAYFTHDVATEGSFDLGQNQFIKRDGINYLKFAAGNIRIRASLIPYFDNDISLGASNMGWKYLFFTDAVDPVICRGPDIHLRLEAANLKCERNFVPGNWSLNLGSSGEYWNEVNANDFVIRGTGGRADFTLGKVRLPVGSNLY